MKAGLRTLIGSTFVALAMAVALPTIQAQGASSTTHKTTRTTTKAAAKAVNTTKTQAPKSNSSKAATVTKPAVATAKPAVTVNPSAATPMASPTAVTKASPKSAVGKLDASNNVKAGAIAKCKDGTYSHASNRAGACSGHKGVASWM